MRHLLVTLALAVLLLALPETADAQRTVLSDPCIIDDLTSGAPQTCTFSTPFSTSAYLWVVTSDETGAADVDITTHLVGSGLPGRRTVCVWQAAMTTEDTYLFLLGSLAAASQDVLFVCDFPLSSGTEIKFTETAGSGATIDLSVRLETLVQ